MQQRTPPRGNNRGQQAPQQPARRMQRQQQMQNQQQQQARNQQAQNQQNQQQMAQMQQQAQQQMQQAGIPPQLNSVGDLKNLLNQFGGSLSAENTAYITELIGQLEGGGDPTSLMELANRMRQSAGQPKK